MMSSSNSSSSYLPSVLMSNPSERSAAKVAIVAHDSSLGIRSQPSLTDPHNVAHGVTIVGRSLCCSGTIRNKGAIEVIPILKDVNIDIPRGTLTAVMGPSGCGKTTLLNLIAGRIQCPLLPTGSELVDTEGKSGRRRRKGKGTLKTSGELYYNGEVVTPSSVRDFSSYVMRSDTLFGYLTVDEAVSFAAKLTLRNMPAAERRLRVEDTLAVLGLRECRHVLIGTDLRKGISGGQKRRVSIAISMISNPELIFLDEPTSGLDSSLAYDTIDVLRKLSISGRTILITIHQPRYQTYSLFDNLVLLKSGELVYHGKAQDCTAYFDQIGHVCPKTFNPADFLLDLLSPISEMDQKLIGKRKQMRELSKREGSVRIIEDHLRKASEIPSPRTAGLQSPDPVFSSQPSISFYEVEKDQDRLRISEEEIAKLPVLFRASDWFVRLLAAQDSHAQEKSDLPWRTYGASRKNAIYSWWVEFVALLKRQVLDSSRDPATIASTGAWTLLISFVVGGLFWDTGMPTSVTDCATVLTVLGLLNFVVSNQTMPNQGVGARFPLLRPIINRETANGLYGTSSYFVARSVGEFMLVLAPLAYATIIFWMARPTDEFTDFCVWTVMLVITWWVAISYGTLMGMCFGEFGISAAVSSNLCILLLYFQGFVTTLDKMPGWLSWVSYFAWTKYLYSAVAQRLLLRGEPQTDATHNCFYIETDLGTWGNFGVALCFGVAFRVLGALSLKFLNRHIGLEM